MIFPWISVGAILGAAAVILGALGAHLPAEDVVVGRFHNTALLFHMVTISPILIIGLLTGKASKGHRYFHLSASLLTLGILFFAGSLYVRSFTGEAIGFYITPTGGIFMIMGWLLLAIGGFLNVRKNQSP